VPRLPARVSALCLWAALACASSGASAHARAEAPEGTSGRVRAELLQSATDESATVRDRATLALELDEGLTAEEVAAALRTAPARAIPGLVRVAASRGFTGLAPEIAGIAAARDAVAAEAAIRALVRLGPDGVAAGVSALAKPDAAGAESRRIHLRCLEAQRRVEREIVSRWRRKGGSYRGRFSALTKEGPEVQVVLVGMLLDIPLEDQYVAQAMSGNAAARKMAIEQLAVSRRRGYVTFDPLPPAIEADSLFSLATQALADVADLATVADVLKGVHDDLLEADSRAGFQARPFERRFAEDVAWVLASRGDPERLEGHLAQAESAARRAKSRIRAFGATPDTAADEFQYYCDKVSEVAGLLHQLSRFDDAAARYAEIVEVRKRIMGKEPATDNYTLACALARGGRRAEALEALRRALDGEVSTGFENLTREWVLEDGDLASLRDDPAFLAAVKRRFGY
jgi:tetratricopeptide (TPR) repeat protein